MASQRTSAGHSRRESATVEIAVGDFIRKNEIGKGSFATVYLASHRVRIPDLIFVRTPWY
jgi:serine/threonine-protein kinase ULK/ATG1